jgi:hypothetical protein
VRGKLIERGDMVTEIQFQVCPKFLKGGPTVNRSCVRDLNRVIREERGPGGLIVAVPYLIKFFKERDKLLAQLWIWRACLLCKGRHSKADCQPYKGYYGADFHCFLPGTVFHLGCTKIWVVKQDAPFTAHYYYWMRKMANPDNMLGVSSLSLEQRYVPSPFLQGLASPLFKRIGRQRGSPILYPSALSGCGLPVDARSELELFDRHAVSRFKRV